MASNGPFHRWGPRPGGLRARRQLCKEPGPRPRLPSPARPRGCPGLTRRRADGSVALRGVFSTHHHAEGPAPGPGSGSPRVPSTHTPGHCPGEHNPSWCPAGVRESQVAPWVPGPARGHMGSLQRLTWDQASQCPPQALSTPQTAGQEGPTPPGHCHRCPETPWADLPRERQQPLPQETQSNPHSSASVLLPSTHRTPADPWALVMRLGGSLEPPHTHSIHLCSWLWTSPSALGCTGEGLAAPQTTQPGHGHHTE